MATATTKPPYDPVKSAEGMFFGSVKRLAYVLKDPANFDQETKTVLAKTVKRFQDVLDDCEIQILDAKWYLEQELAANKARREAKAREEGLANAKRKHDEMKGVTENGDEQQAEQSTKRLKTVETSTEVIPSIDPGNTPEALVSVDIEPQDEKEVKRLSESSAKEESEAKPRQLQLANEHTEPSAPEKTLEQDPNPQQSQPQTSTDDYQKASPQASPTATNEDFHFVSMFGEPTGDFGDDLDTGGDDMNFGLNLGDDLTNNLNDATTMQDSTNLDSFLPNADDNNSTTNMTGFNLDGALDNSSNTTKAQDHQQQPETADGGGESNNNNNNILNLPDLPGLDGPNEFDDFLNQTDFGDATTFDENVNLSDEAMLNMDVDFDSLF